jgi:hypothetical protein
MAFAVRIKQNYKLIPEELLVGLAVSQYDIDKVEFVQYGHGPMLRCHNGVPMLSCTYSSYKAPRNNH